MFWRIRTKDVRNTASRARTADKRLKGKGRSERARRHSKRPKRRRAGAEGSQSEWSRRTIRPCETPDGAAIAFARLPSPARRWSRYSSKPLSGGCRAYDRLTIHSVTRSAARRAFFLVLSTVLLCRPSRPRRALSHFERISSSSSSVRCSIPTKELCTALTLMSSSSLTWMAALSRFSGVLDQEDHQERHDRGAGVDHQLPRVGVVEDWPGDRPNDHDRGSDHEGQRTAGGLGCAVGDIAEELSGALARGTQSLRHRDFRSSPTCKIHPDPPKMRRNNRNGTLKFHYAIGLGLCSLRNA